MGTTLTGTTPQTTYDSLIKVTDNAPLTGSLKTLTDGLGNDSALALSTGAASVTGTLAVSSNLTVDTDTLFVDAANNQVGIGTSSLFGKFNLADASNARLEATPVADGVSFEVLDSARANPLDFKVFANDITFNTKVSGSYTERMRVDSAGLVGIGTSSPSELLHLSTTLGGSSGVGTAIQITSGGAGGDQAFIGVNKGTGNGLEISVENRDIIFNTGALTPFGGTERMRITSSGNVGIGTSSPSIYSTLTLNKDGASEYSSVLATNANSTAALYVGVGGSSVGNTALRNNAYVLNASASDLILGTSDTERMRITSTGAVGIGTTSPNTKLRIVDSTTNPPLSIQNTNADGYSGSWLYNSAGTLVGHWGWANGTTTALSDKMYFGTIANKDVVFTTNDTEKVRITAAGNVGIGTTSPNAPLHVIKDLGTSVSAVTRLRGSNSTARTTRLQFEDYNGTLADGLIDFVIPTAGSATGARLDIGVDSAIVSVVRGGNVGIGTTSPANNLHVYGANGSTIAIDAAGANNSGLQYKTGGSLSAAITYVPSTTQLHFYNGGDVMVVGTSNVGIGTTSPATKLDVAGVTRSGAFLTNDATTTSIPIDTGGSKAYFDASNINGPAITLRADSVGRTIRMYDGNSSVAAIDTNSGGLYIATNSSHPISFAPNASEAMRIAVGGSVGIGTTSPYGRLELSGSGQSWTTAPAIRMWDSFNSKGWLVGNVNNITAGDFYIRTLPSVNGAPSTGQQEFTIKHATGNVGIGTTSPASKFHIAGADAWLTLQRTSGTTNIIDFTDASSNRIGYVGAISSNITISAAAGNSIIFAPNNAEAARITSTGAVGIGTSSPSQKLHVEGSIALAYGSSLHAANATYTTLLETGYNGSSDFVSLYTAGNNAANATAKITMLANGNCGIGTSSPAQKLDVRGSSGTIIQAKDSASYCGLVIDSGAASTPFTRLSVNAVGKFETGYFNNLYYLNNNTGVDDTGAAMVITSAGNVGIGTTAPNAKLNVFGAVGSGSVTVQEDLLHIGGNELGGVGGYAGIRLAGTSSSSYGVYIRGVKTLAYGNYWNDALTFSVTRTNTETTIDEVMRITSDGNVGIGTTSPGEKLEVNGNINLSSNGGYFLNGALTLFPYLNDTYIRPYTSSGSVNFQNYSGSSTLTITSGGNVGIGTTSPSGKLHVYGGSFITDLDATYHQGILNELVSIYVSRTKFGRWNTSSNLEIYYDIAGTEEARITRNYSGATLKFNRAGTTDMIINGSGNVGIGTTSPLEKLHVAGNEILGDVGGSTIGYNSTIHTGAGNQTSGTIRAFYGFTNPSGLYVNVGDAWAWKMAMVARPGVGGNYNSQLEILRTTRDGVTDATTMAFSREGNVGIGTTAPTNVLHVVGVPRFDASGGAPSASYVPDGGFGVDSLITSTAENVALGKPDEWLKVDINGTAYLIPAYAI